MSLSPLTLSQLDTSTRYLDSIPRRCWQVNSVSEGHVPLISSVSMVCLLKDGDPVGLSVSRSVGFSERTVLIGRTGFDTRSDTVFKPAREH